MKTTKMVARLEMANGETVNLDKALQRLLKTQDLQAWKGDMSGLRHWIAESVYVLIENCAVVIETNPGTDKALLQISGIKRYERCTTTASASGL